MGQNSQSCRNRNKFITVQVYLGNAYATFEYLTYFMCRNKTSTPIPVKPKDDGGTIKKNTNWTFIQSTQGGSVMVSAQGLVTCGNRHPFQPKACFSLYIKLYEKPEKWFLVCYYCLTAKCYLSIIPFFVICYYLVVFQYGVLDYWIY